MKSKRANRQVILKRLFDLLQERYASEWSEEQLREGQISLQELDILLAFKSDPDLDGLRSALTRLDEGAYGVCLSCKNPIDQDVLDNNPAERFCSECERYYNQTSYSAPDPGMIAWP